MSSSSKRLRNISPEPAAIHAIADARQNFGFDTPSPSRSATSSEYDDDSDDSTSSYVFPYGVNKLLPVILDNLGILTPKDLLHCRLVSRCWLDAATAVLVKRSACEIALKIGEVAPGGGGGEDRNSYEQLLDVNPSYDRDELSTGVFKYFSARPPHSLLPDLIQTISGSKEFPSSSITFLPGCEIALKNLRHSRPSKMYRHADDELVRLFSLWGKNIQKLSICDGISSNSVEKLLFLLTPNLRCLDFSKCYKFKTRHRDTKHNEVFHLGNEQTRKLDSDRRLGKLETIIPGVESELHWSKKEFFQLLVHISPNLRAVEDAGVGALILLVNMKKAHLMKSLFYVPVSRHEHECGSLKEELELYLSSNSNPSIKLSRLIIELSGIRGKRSAYGSVRRILNLILRESKHTLEYLELHVNPLDFLVNIRIPPLKKLKCLKLIRQNESFLNPLWSRKSTKWGKRESGENVALDRYVYERDVFQFQDRKNPYKISPNYFPALSTVELDDGDSGSVNTANKLIAFFSLEHPRIEDGSIVSGDVIKSVSTLELSAFPKVDNKLGQLFPNLRNLKIKCESGTELGNWVWRAFRKLERFEIYDFLPGTDEDAVDSFFTGIPREFCAKVAANIESIPRPEFTTQQNLFYRTQPYIVDCRKLKEFRIQFSEKISATFATKLSSLFALQGIINKTKIVFSFENVDLSEPEVKEMKEHLKPVIAYIEIRL